MTTPDIDPLQVLGAMLASIGASIALVAYQARLLRVLTGALVALPLGALATGAWFAVVRIHPDFTARFTTRWVAAGGAATSLLGGLFIGLWNPDGASRVRVVRGTRVVGGAPRGRLVGGRGGVHFAGVPVPVEDEAKHFKLIGTTGTGKSTAIRALLRDALDRGDRAVVADPDGVYRAMFEDRRRGDRSLNPLDRTTDVWDLFGELDAPEDADALARALIPDGGGDDRAWRQYARVFLASLLRQLKVAGVEDPAEVHRLVSCAEVDELRLLLGGTAAAAYVSQENGRFFASVRAIASSDLAVLESVARQRAASATSVRTWVRGTRPNGTGGVLYLPYRANHLATVRGLVAAWLRLAIFEAMSTQPGTGRLWFIVDELDALGMIDGLKDALTRLRKYEGRCVLGIQSIAQLSGTYGSQVAQTIIENCGNTLLLRCSASEQGGTSRFASTLIGDREVLRTQLSHTRPAAFGRAERSRSVTMQQHIERAVLPAELEQLPDLHGYLKLASEPMWRRIAVPR
jgi:type IV secretory pathway TraG/TraD family ATPase VirD4